MPRILAYYIAVSLFLGIGVFGYLAFQYAKIYWKVAHKKSKKEIALKGDIVTISTISIVVTLFWLPLLVWYAFNKLKGVLKKS